MEVVPMGHGVTNPKTPIPPTRADAWSSSGPPVCHGPLPAHSRKSSPN
jgi:hypothetical protein